MALLSRWVRPPAEFRSSLAGAERVLAQADANDTVVIATNLGLWLPDAAPLAERTRPPWRRISWDRVVKATWVDGRLDVTEGDLDSDGVVLDRPPVSIALTVARNLPSVVRTRVETSIARSEQVTVPGGTGRVVARRVPGVDGITWTARLDTGTVDTPDARAVLAEYRRQAAARTEA